VTRDRVLRAHIVESRTKQGVQKVLYVVLVPNVDCRSIIVALAKLASNSMEPLQHFKKHVECGLLGFRGSLLWIHGCALTAD